MTRYAMTIDLRRCAGCQTCTAACKNANATPPGVQWRRVLDMESGEFPNVRRSFVPVACMHCDSPPCEEVCPTTATRKADGTLTVWIIDDKENGLASAKVDASAKRIDIDKTCKNISAH